MARKRERRKRPRQRLLSIAQAAEVHGITTQALYRRIKVGDLRARKVDGRWVVTRADLRASDQLIYERHHPEPEDPDDAFLYRLWASDPDD